jgi:hypothetical protein
MVRDLERAEVGAHVALGNRYGELGSWCLDYAATTLLVRARLVNPPKVYLNFGVSHRLAAAYDGFEAAEAPNLSSAAAAGRLVAAWATVAVVTRNAHWLRPAVLHAVAASDYATPSMRARADPRLLG